MFPIGENIIGFGGFNSTGGIPKASLLMEETLSQYLSMSDADFGAFNLAKFGISAHFKIQSAGSNNLFRIGKATTYSPIWLGIDSSDKIFFMTSQDGLSRTGALVRTASFTDTTAYHHLYVTYDSANGTAGDRMKMWLDGTEITAFSTDTNPTAAVEDTSTQVSIGRSEDNVNYFDGNIFQMAFFSGTLPDISQLYNAGQPMDVTHLPGLWSQLDVSGGDVTSDSVRTAAWSNNNGVVASGVTP